MQRGQIDAPSPKIEKPFKEFGYGVCFQNTVGGGEGGNPVINVNQFTGGNNANYNAASYEFGEQDYTGIGVGRARRRHVQRRLLRPELRRREPGQQQLGGRIRRGR